MYRDEGGIKSFMLDDDNCDCYTTLSMGKVALTGSHGKPTNVRKLTLTLDVPDPGHVRHRLQPIVRPMYHKWRRSAQRQRLQQPRLGSRPHPVLSYNASNHHNVLAVQHVAAGHPNHGLLRLKPMLIARRLRCSHCYAWKLLPHGRVPITVVQSSMSRLLDLDEHRNSWWLLRSILHGGLLPECVICCIHPSS